MSFRAVEDGVASSPNGEIFPIAEKFRIASALEKNVTTPQSARFHGHFMPSE